MLISQVVELQPSDRQESAFRSHAAAARIARNDLVALWREEGKRLKGFRFKTVELRPQVNRVKYAVHPWFRELSQNAVKGGMIDAVDAIERYYRCQNRRPRFLGRNNRLRFRIDNGAGTVKVDGSHLLLPTHRPGAYEGRVALAREGHTGVPDTGTRRSLVRQRPSGDWRRGIPQGNRALTEEDL